MPWLRRLTPRHWSWLHFKLTLIVWMLVLLSYTPDAIHAAVGALIWAISGVALTGATISILGIVMTAQTGRTALLGLSVELAGIYLMAAGPISYFAIQVYLAITLPDGDQRYALCVLAYALIAALFCRFIIVRGRRRAEATDETKTVG